jgi:hypothetical protein
MDLLLPEPPDWRHRAEVAEAIADRLFAGYWGVLDLLPPGPYPSDIMIPLQEYEASLAERIAHLFGSPEGVTER